MRPELHPPGQDGAKLIAALADARPGSCRRLVVPAGHVLCHEGDEGRSLYVIISGQVEIRLEEGSATRPIPSRSSGSVVGELSLLTGERRTATLIASTPSELWEITDDGLSAAADAGEPWAAAVLLEAARRLARWVVLVRAEVAELIAVVPDDVALDDNCAGNEVSELEKLRRSLVAEWPF